MHWVAELAGATKPCIVILSNERDFGTDLVIRSLTAKGAPFVRLNAERAHAHGIPMWTTYQNAQIFAVWYRQFERPLSPESLDTYDQSLVSRSQWRQWLSAVSTDATFELNPLHAARKAEAKPFQLGLARRVGFLVPETAITNDRAAALVFRERHGPSVIKALSAGFFESNGSFVFTQMLSSDILQIAENDWFSQPVIVQRTVTAKQQHTIGSRRNRLLLL